VIAMTIRNISADPSSSRFSPKGNPMQSRFIKTLLASACALAPLAMLPATPAQAQATVAPAQDLVLSIGRGELLTVPVNMADIFVSNEAVADVQVKSQRQLYIFGLTPGETTVYVSNAAGDIIWSANVRVGSNLDSVDQMLTLAMPDAQINVATMGSNTMLLTGTVGAPEDAAEAERLVSAFVGDEVNVISRLRMATPLQVNLRVRFAEVSRSLARNLGVNLTTLDGTSGFQFGFNQGRAGFAPNFYPGTATGVGSEVTVTVPDPANPGQFIQIPGTNIAPISPGSTLAGVGSLLGLDIAGALDAGEREGLVVTLSEPNLTALSGETAEFLAGGEFPIPQSAGLGATSIIYKNYGVSLSYTPTVLSNGRISIRVKPEVSELSSQGAVTVGGFSIPALVTRRAETTVELGSGESFMIAGLMSNNSQNTIDRTPGAGDIPVLGALFRSTSFQRGETELVIVVTPYLVQPISDRQISLPTDGYAVPNAAEQFFLQRDSAGRAGAVRPMPSAAGGSAANPAVSLNDQNGSALANGQSGTAAQTAEAATPGFSLN
jgi:pilus assembly protein CpaC